MRTFLTILLLVACVRTFSQDLADSLSKYSYLVHSGPAGENVQATGFFARYQQRLFFVTAAHCLTGWDPFRFRRIENFPDTLFIRTSNDTGNLHFLPIPLDGIKETARPFREYETPDVYVVEIKNPKAYPVHSVEQYFMDRIRCDAIRAIWIFGYPLRKGVNQYLTERQQPLASTGSLGEAYCLYAFRPEARQPDQLNYFTDLKECTAAPGFSGSPVFLLTEEKKIVFGGIYIGGADNALRTGMVVRPEFVIREILTKLKKH